MTSHIIIKHPQAEGMCNRHLAKSPLVQLSRLPDPDGPGGTRGMAFMVNVCAICFGHSFEGNLSAELNEADKAGSGRAMMKRKMGLLAASLGNIILKRQRKSFDGVGQKTIG